MGKLLATVGVSIQIKRAFRKLHIYCTVPCNSYLTEPFRALQAATNTSNIVRKPGTMSQHLEDGIGVTDVSMIYQPNMRQR